MKWLIVALLLLSLFGIVRAANFTASVIPTSIEANTSVTFNFSISNNDTVNITKVEIYLQEKISYSGGQGNSNNASFSYDGTERKLIWTKDDLIVPNQTTYFWFDAQALSYYGEQNFTVSTLDENNQTSQQNVSVFINDTISPIWSNNATFPPSPKKYDESTIFFNLTWRDNVKVDTVLIEANFSGQAENYTASSSGNTYYINISNLTPGTYYWLSYANDTAGNLNKSDVFYYVVEKGLNPIKIFVNGQEVKQSITVTNESKINITATGKGTVKIFKGGTEVASSIGIASYNDYFNVGTYTINVTASGNELYESNQTAISLHVDYPAPYVVSVSTNVPSYYQDVYSTFEVVWADYNDPNAFNFSILEANFSGQAENYTMTKNGNKSSFSIKLNAGYYYWIAYANNSFGKWGKTQKYYFEIRKASPEVKIFIFPEEIVYEGTQTTVLCTSTANTTLTLYRNDTLVNNPDEANLTAGYYVYKCVASETTNYMQEEKTAELRVISYTAKLNVVNYTSQISLEVGQQKTVSLVIENAGDLAEKVELEISGIKNSWFEIKNKSIVIKPNEQKEFLIVFNTSNATPGSYEGSYEIKGNLSSARVNFILKILMSKSQKQQFRSKLQNQTARLNKLKSKVLELKENELTAIYNDTLSLLELAQNYLNNNEYEKLRVITNQIDQKLKQLNEKIIEVENIRRIENFRRIITYVGATIVGIVVIFLAYLLWPTP